MNMEVASLPETPITIYKLTRFHISEELHLHE